MLGPTSRILPPSISTWAEAKSPTWRSGQHHAALEENATLPLQAGKLGIGRAGTFRKGVTLQSICAAVPLVANATLDLRKLRRDVPPAGP